MKRTRAMIVAAAVALATLTACAARGPEQPDLVAMVADPNFKPEYKGIETTLLDGDLVQFNVAMKGARNKQDVANYAECAAAQYALIRGFGFARHLRTNIAESGGTWRADAVYTISAALPNGLRTIDAEVTVRNCGSLGIPTV
jgi:predicted small lipoprotein YifL